jgi:hypothetical protein
MKILSLLLGIGLVVVEPMADSDKSRRRPCNQDVQKSPPAVCTESENLALSTSIFPAAAASIGRRDQQGFRQAPERHHSRAKCGRANHADQGRERDRAGLVPGDPDGVGAENFQSSLPTGPGNQKAIQYKNTSLSFSEFRSDHRRDRLVIHRDGPD